ncbi:hypothetical protein XENOCAPTIV_022661, partial [Xenoophorus captivus]
MTLFDDQGNKTSVPNKERQIEALQLLFLLLPQANRSLLKLLLDLLYHTAKQQDKNKMSAYNLALMFAPHVIWPRHAPVYLREYARIHFTGTKVLQSKLVKQAHPGTPNEDHLVPPAASKKHPRSRSFGGLIKMNSPSAGPVMGKAGLVVKNPDFTFHKDKALKVSKV